MFAVDYHAGTLGIEPVNSLVVGLALITAAKLFSILLSTKRPGGLPPLSKGAALAVAVFYVAAIAILIVGWLNVPAAQSVRSDIPAGGAMISFIDLSFCSAILGTTILMVIEGSNRRNWNKKEMAENAKIRSWL